MRVDQLDSRALRIAELGFDYDAQPKELLERCNLCHGDVWTTIAHTDRYGYAAATTACNTCSLSVLNPRMTSEAYAEFYRSTYRPLVSAYHGRLIDAKTVKREQLDYAEHIALVLGRVHPEGSSWQTLLDIGGSTGVVAAHLSRRFGMTPTVIDPALDELTEADRVGIETIPGFVEDWSSDGRRFDLVGMFQTLDHLLDIASTLGKVRTVLADGGLFVADIVDFRAAYLRAWSVEEATKIDHPFSLMQPTIEAYFRRAGLPVTHKSFSPDHLHVLYLCRKAAPDPNAVPSFADVSRYFYELRYVQAAPRPHS